MVNIKLSSSEINTTSLKKLRQSEVRSLSSFLTGDDNISLYVNPTEGIIYLRFIRREYYLNTEAAILRLKEIQEVENRFKEYAAKINVHF